jgi:hypothetical protein
MSLQPARCFKKSAMVLYALARKGAAPPSSLRRLVQMTQVGALVNRAHVAIALVGRLAATFHDAAFT